MDRKEGELFDRDVRKEKWKKIQTYSQNNVRSNMGVFIFLCQSI